MGSERKIKLYVPYKAGIHRDGLSAWRPGKFQMESIAVAGISACQLAELRRPCFLQGNMDLEFLTAAD